MTTQEILEAARSAKSALALADNTARNAALLGMADALCSADDQAAILAANAEDMAAAKGHISDVMLDRLALTAPRIEAMAQGIREVATLPDPVGRVLNRVERPNGLVIEKTAVPMGVIAIIYESRPNVTSDAAALAIKNGNAYQYDLRIFCHQRIPEYLVQQLAEPSAEPLKYINFGSYQLTTVSKRRVRLPSGNLCSITNQCISRSHIHSPLSEFIKIVNITLHHHIIYLFRSMTVLISQSQQ